MVGVDSEKVRILVVDDEMTITRALTRLLARRGYDCAAAGGASEARAKLARETPYHLILCDVNMPGESGLELIRDVHRSSPETAVVMVTGVDDPGLAELALELGASGYVIKPFEANEILINVANALRRRTLEIENRQHRDLLEQTLIERTAELRQAVSRLQRLTEDLRHSREETISRLARAAEFRHNETAQHVQRMSRYAELLSRKLGYADERCELIRAATPLHDVGKIGIPDSILLKPGPLTDGEYAQMRRHPEIGFRILSGSESKLLNLAAQIALTHHERYDGSGYPNGIAAQSIPIEGRIAAVADVFDALTTTRVYRKALPLNEALDIMRAGRGSHFEPQLLDLFIESLDEVLEIKEAWADLAT